MADKIYISRKLPPHLLFLFGIAVPISIASILSAIFQTDQPDFAALMFFLGFPIFFYLYLSDRGYQIAWDDQRIYMRAWSFQIPSFRRFPEQSMAYDDIASMEGKFKGNAAEKSNFMPFEFLELQSSQPGVEDLWIYPPSLRDKEVKSFLKMLYEKRPDIFPDYAIGYMNSEKSL